MKSHILFATFWENHILVPILYAQKGDILVVP